MRKTIAIRISSDWVKNHETVRSGRIDLSILVPRCIELSSKFKICRQYFEREKKDIIRKLESQEMSLDEARLSYNSLLQDVLEYLKKIILPDREEAKEGIFITITGSAPNQQASFDSDLDMDVYTYGFSLKDGARLFRKFSSALRKITGHKVEPFFKNVANFEAQHHLPPHMKYLWSTQIGFFKRIVFSLLKRFFRLFYGAKFFKAENCGPIRVF